MGKKAILYHHYSVESLSFLFLWLCAPCFLYNFFLCLCRGGVWVDTDSSEELLCTGGLSIHIVLIAVHVLTQPHHFPQAYSIWLVLRALPLTLQEAASLCIFLTALHNERMRILFLWGWHPSLPPVAVIKTMTESKLGKKGSISFYRLQSITASVPARRGIVKVARRPRTALPVSREFKRVEMNLEAGTKAETMEKLLTDLFPKTFSFVFFYNPKPTVCTGPGLPIYIITQFHAPTDMATSKSDRGNSSTKFLLSRWL